MNLSVAIVGLPNAGKSTLFNALLKKQAALAANYPFATIDPNVGIVPVPDARLAVLAKIVVTQKIVPATVEFVDIAGLVRGAHKGEGLGNQFLANIRETSALCYVLRFFEDGNVVHLAGRVDPLNDLTILNEELVLADLQTLEKQKKPPAIVEALKRHLNNNQPARTLAFTQEDLTLIKPLNLLTLKPAIYVANMGESQLVKSREVLADFPQRPVIALSAKTEAELIDLPDTERQELLSAIGVTEPALNRLAQTAFTTLGLMTFLTAGSIEARAWTIKQGTFAPEAAAAIHTDFTKKFIKADVVSYDDFVRAGGWQKSREQGLVRSEGRDYIMKEGDVVEFKIGS